MREGGAHSLAREMTMKKTIATMALGLLLSGGLALAKKPVENVSGKKHPNIAAAQKLSEEAFEKLTAAQEANEFDMQGHAKKAKELLEQANKEMKLAAEAANEAK
jgi:F0F1-type ATP synthase membrane subunit b/b'